MNKTAGIVVQMKVISDVSKQTFSVARGRCVDVYVVAVVTSDEVVSDC